MSKILTVPKEERCIGCGLCSIKASLIKSKKIDLANSFIKITGPPGRYKVIIDYGTRTDYKEIVDVCPRGCFEIADEKKNI